MSQLDALLERSRCPGSFIERRKFSLSRDKAIGKLREFALRNPREYVLELIQSAVFSGATYIAVDVEESRCVVAWVGGRPFTERQLSALFDHLFLDRNDLEHRPIVQLAVALNAVLQRKPRRLRIESGDGRADSTVRIDLDRKGRGVLGTPEEGLAGTYISAEFGLGWFDRFGDGDPTAEERLIEERCRYSPVPILLNGRAPFGYRASRQLSMVGCPHFLSFDDGERHGVVAVPPRITTASGFAMVVGGVRISTVDLPELGQIPVGFGGRDAPSNLAGVVVDDTLRKTADHSDIVRERRFAEMLHAVQPHATTLVRQLVDEGYQPPALPKLVGGAKVEEALPTLVEQLGPRPGYPRDALGRIAEGTPVFRVRPQDAEALLESTSPDRFPHPVLVVPDRQVLSLEKAAPQLSIHSLSSPAEVALLDRVLERRVVLREHAMPFTDPDHPFRVGVLRLFLHVAGPAPLLSDPADGDVSIVVLCKDRVHRCDATPLGLPGVRAVLDLGASQPPGEDEYLGGLDQALLEGAWGLLGQGRSESEQRLLVALLAAHIRPHFVVRDGVTTLEAGFPTFAGVDLEPLRSLPLARTGRGDLRFDDLIALMGTGEVLELAGERELDLLLPLEEKLGPGHLTTASTARLAIAAVGRGSFGWSRVPPNSEPSARVQRLLWVGPCLAPRFDIPGWQVVDLGLPFVGAAVREGDDLDEPGWEAGQRELLRELIHQLTPDAYGIPPRERAACRLAALHLADTLGRLRFEPLMVALGDATWSTVDEWLADPAHAAWPRHGPAALEHGVVQLYLDELRVLERTGPIPVRFDDPPEVWDSLAEPGDSGWLVRREVTAPGLRGWLGLRIPFDPTAGVFLQADGVRIALAGVDRPVPCHGLLRHLAGATVLGETHNQLLLLARERLYAQLTSLVREGSAEVREAAQQYQDLYLAARKRLEAPPPEPSPTPTMARVGAVLEEIEHRLIEASGGVLADHISPVVAFRYPTGIARLADLANADTTGDGLIRLRVYNHRVQLGIARDHPIGGAALAHPGREREIVVMELIRQLAAYAADKVFAFDLFEAQSVLVAQRLDWSPGG